MMGFFCNYLCIFCDTLSKRDIDLCATCEDGLPVLKNYCVRCAEPLPKGQDTCGFCLNISPAIIKTIALFSYQPPINRLLTNIKFGNNLIGARVLGELLANRLVVEYKNKTMPEVIIPVPLHPDRLHERGYNQALELVKPAAKRLQIPIDRFMVKRVKNTLAQAMLSAKERTQNIKQAFYVSPELRYQYVAVVDDVITTGNTVNELCNSLVNNGVKRIDVWCFARSSFK